MNVVVEFITELIVLSLHTLDDLHLWYFITKKLLCKFDASINFPLSIHTFDVHFVAHEVKLGDTLCKDDLQGES